MKLIKIAGSGPSFLPYSSDDLRWRRQLDLGKSSFVSSVSDIFSLLALSVEALLLCSYSRILICLIFTRALSPSPVFFFLLLQLSD